MSNSNQHTVCIIGGGMSGLFTGALLAKKGYKVTVLEKNAIIGGGLQSFRRGDAVFNTGMQVFVGYGNRFALHYLMDYLGITKEKLNPIPTNSNAQEIVWLSEKCCYRLPKGRIAYEAYLISQFPKEKDGIHLFLEAVYEIGKTFDYFFLRPMQPHPEIVKYASITAEQLIRQYICDEQLVRLIAYTSIHIGLNLSKAPAIELGMMMTLYIEGSWHLNDGNIILAQHLATVIANNGGQVINNSEVKRLHVSNDRIEWVETDSERYFADVFVSSITPHLLLLMADGEIFRAATKSRLDTYFNKFSGYAVFVKFKDKAFPYMNSSIFVPIQGSDEILPQYINAITPSVSNQDEWACTMEIYVPCRYDIFQHWEHTFTGRRNDNAYEQLKKQLAQTTITYLSHFYPQLESAIEEVHVGTSLTLRDYYGNHKGETYSQQGLFIPVKTRANNMFLTGQAVMYQGLFGVATTSIIVAETILQKSLIEEIARA